MSRIFFKTLYRNAFSGELESYCRNDSLVGRGRERAIRYFVGHWVKPTIPNSRLFVCDTVEECIELHKRATQYSRVSSSNFPVYECAVKNPAKVDIVPSPDIYNATRFWRKVEEARQKKERPDYSKILDELDLSEILTFSKGTFGGTAVKLLREVKF